MKYGFINVDDEYVATVKAFKRDEVDMTDVMEATAWPKLIVANIDPKMHATTFLMEHAILIFILMTRGFVNLPRIMRDIMVKWPFANTSNLLLYPMFITRLADQYQVPEFVDEFLKIREVPPSEQQPPSPQPHPSSTDIPHASVCYSREPSLKEVMRYLRCQERLRLNTQSMLREAFLDKEFMGLLHVSSTEDDSDAES
ncbi:hypothetical protein PIB30_070913 [Stylosanthes scabra]|uniref:Uncharacterized protein n=1 Tax=Stylosanthes scabra TaxID=79078 RepID=A0ABU6WQA4_9FABA|nr:hypothetical protein [Stylosanthes scabra]